MIDNKKCPKCDLVKETIHFHIYFSKKRNKERVGNYCIECAKKESLLRAKKHYIDNQEEKKEYAKNYRSNPLNIEKIKALRCKFRIKYRKELQDCYVREVLSIKNGISTEISRVLPEIVESRRLQIQIRRKIKQLK